MNDKPLRVLIVSPTFLPNVGGAELGIHEIAKRLGTHHEVRILTPDAGMETSPGSDAGEDRDYAPVNYRVIRFRNPFRPRGSGPWAQACKLLDLSGLFTIRALRKECRANPPDVINFHYPVPLGLTLVYAQRFLRAPVVLSMVGRLDVCRPESPWPLRRFISSVTRCADRTLLISRYMFPNPPPRASVRVIPFGVDVHDIRPMSPSPVLRTEFRLDESDFVLFGLQRLAPVKRVDVLIRMMPIILARHPRVRLLIGGTGEDEVALHALIDENQLQEGVQLLGYIEKDRLPEIFSLSDLFVFHSMAETFGIVFAQAMAAGKAIVTVDNTCIPEVVEDGVNGLLAPTADPEAMAQSVIALIEDPSLRQKMEEENRRKALDLYDWDRIAASYEETFYDVHTAPSPEGTRS